MSGQQIQTKVLISKKALLSNYKYLSSLNPNIRIAPVIKSQAYGHGLIEIAKILDVLKPAFLCVNNLDEAITLQKNGISSDILILGFVAGDILDPKKYPFMYTAHSLEEISQLGKLKGIRVQLKLDSGMNRSGISFDQIRDGLSKIKQSSNIHLLGIYSHLASADNVRSSQNIKQMNCFRRSIQIVNNNHTDLRWIHLGNSLGLLNYSRQLGVFTNTARTGKALYGLYPYKNKSLNLKPVLKFVTKIVQIKIVKKGERVGYGGSFKTSKNLVIGIIPIGYYDGVDRRLSNRGFVKVNNNFCQIIGKVSMNMTTIDISNVENPIIGLDVTVYSDDHMDKNSIENSAKLCKTIPYDLLVGIHHNIPRIIID